MVNASPTDHTPGTVRVQGLSSSEWEQEWKRDENQDGERGNNLAVC